MGRVGGPATFQSGPAQSISEETGVSRRLVKVIIPAVDIVDRCRRQLVGSDIVKQVNLDCPEITAQCFSNTVRGRADAAIFAELVVKVRFSVLIPTEAATFNEMMSPLITR